MTLEKAQKQPSTKIQVQNNQGQYCSRRVMRHTTF